MSSLGSLRVLFSLKFPGAGESDRMTMTFVFDVITSGGERSSGWCVRAAVCLGRALAAAAAAVGEEEVEEEEEEEVEEEEEEVEEEEEEVEMEEVEVEVEERLVLSHHKDMNDLL
ncbi:hypothetical protein DPX16_19360 [Anabarilius grahami]|uniref:Uncharacterized protein n=1 Tax=Anabarilius grahami TaxID=495550 RepID=A0A3N0Z0N7_ANAGA|nr:hypothetical protein DPX16_19360 [Anabarilius grahami]